MEDTEMNVTDLIRRVSVVSTGQVQIRPDHVTSTWRPTAAWLLSSPLPELRGLMRRHIDLPGLRWRRVTPEPIQDPGVAPTLASA
jgi:hypothetical protein